MYKTQQDISDSPTTVDLLGFKKFSVPLARKIASATNENTPLSIGVYGQWGAGKTSFLLMVDEELKNQGVFPIWFNAWKYEQENNLWSALLQTILDQAQVHGNWLQRARLKLNLWWNNVSLKAGLWETSKKVVPVIIRLLIFTLFAFIAVGSNKKQIADFLTHLPVGNLPINPTVFPPWFVKALSAIVAIFSLKPDSLISPS